MYRFPTLVVGHDRAEPKIDKCGPNEGRKRCFGLNQTVALFVVGINETHALASRVYLTSNQLTECTD